MTKNRLSNGLYRLALCALVLSFSGAIADTEKGVRREPKSITIEFLAIGKPSFLKIKGKADGATGFLEQTNQGTTGKFIVKTETLDTGISLRNQHMNKKYLESEKFSEITLVVLNWDVYKKGDTIEQGERPFGGQLELHGVKKPVQGTVKVENSTATGFSFLAKFKINISEFGVEIPTYMGIKVADEVSIDVAGTF